MFCQIKCQFPSSRRSREPERHSMFIAKKSAPFIFRNTTIIMHAKKPHIRRWYVICALLHVSRKTVISINQPPKTISVLRPYFFICFIRVTCYRCKSFFAFFSLIFLGAYVASGSSSNGFVFVWNAKNGQLVRILDSGHQNAGVCGIAWGRGGDSGQQVASTDKAGKLILWG